MAYSQRYYAAVQEIDNLKKHLADLDSDYATLHECKQKLASCSVLFGDVSTQCDDINRAFNRGTIEGRYDACGIDFKTKKDVFEYLEIIGSSTNKFNSSCNDVKTQIDEFGASLDGYCKDIANEAQVVSDKINSLMSQLVYLMEPEPPK
ncbi:MAG: hypothetical protein IJ568_01350 [Bacilli bacterium]|nr:hypothetical protein [Bacilli bacterium]